MEDLNYDKNTVYVYGDSHVELFVGMKSPELKVIVAGYSGASISGLNETTSTLQYGKYVMDIVKNEPKTYYHLIKLGQVDLEFILYYKIYVKKEIFTFVEFCDTLMKKYHEFVSKILEINKNVIIVSINLPAYHEEVDIRNYIKRTILNGNDWNYEDSNDNLDPILRDFSLVRMTKNFMYFNERLCDLAKGLNIPFFDVTESFIDKDTNLLKYNYKDYNHHYKGCYEAESDARNLTYNFLELFFQKNIKKFN